MRVKISIDLAKLKIESLDRDWFIVLLNSTRYKNHSCNKVFDDKVDKPIAIKCNCGGYHLIEYEKLIRISWEKEVKYQNFQGRLKKAQKKSEMSVCGAW